MNHRIFLVAALASALLALAAAGDDLARPGPTDKGFLLPNGWTITPVPESLAAPAPIAIAPSRICAA